MAGSQLFLDCRWGDVHIVGLIIIDFYIYLQIDLEVRIIEIVSCPFDGIMVIAANNWKVHLAKEDLKQSKLSRSYVQKIDYRPFDQRFTYYTGELKRFISTPRKNIMNHMLDEDNIGLMVTR